MLGGYIDGGDDAPGVLDTLITIREEYGGRTVFLRGDHEELMLRSITGTEKDYYYWIQNGGVTTIENYLQRANLRSSPEAFPQNRLKDIIPLSHIEFLQSLPYHFDHDDFFFFHGGFNYKIPLLDNNPTTFAFDTVANRVYKGAWADKRFLDVEKMNHPDKVMVGAHNSGKVPVIFPRYFILGGTAPNSIICGDLNSMEFVKAKRRKSRIYKTNIKIIEQ